MPRYQTKVAVISSGASVSDAIDVSGAGLFGLWAPIVTSCQMFLQGAFENVSASFVRLQNAAGSGDWTFAVGAGSKAVTLAEAGAFPFPFAKLETSVVQADTRSFAIPVKLR